MSMFWKEISPHDFWYTRTLRPLHAADLHVLLHLYQPLVGATSIGLYLTLTNQLLVPEEGRSRMEPHLHLMNLLSLPLPEMLEARYRLEGVGLLNTYQSEKDDHQLLEYEVIPPLSAIDFFQSDVLSIALFNRLGKEKYLQLRRTLIGPKLQEPEEEKQNITKSFHQVYGSLSPEEIAAVARADKESLMPVTRASSFKEDGQPPPFEPQGKDLELIRARISPLLKSGVWTKELERELLEISFLFQLDEWDLLQALQNPEVTRGGRIDLDRLRSFVKSEYQLRFGGAPPIVTVRKEKFPEKQEEKKVVPEASRPDEMAELSEEERHRRELARISPLELLSNFQDGMRIPDADLELVDRLMHQYGLPSGVINVLLEYVLYTHDFRLPRALVEKIAGHWKRRRVETVEEAMELARNELNWEWKRSEKKQQPRQTARRPVAQREEKIPRVLKEEMQKKEGSSTPSQVPAVDPEARARIMDQLSRMRQRLNQRMKEKEN